MTSARKPMMNDQRPAWAPDDPADKAFTWDHDTGIWDHDSGTYFSRRQQSERDNATYYSQSEQIEALWRENARLRAELHNRHTASRVMAGKPIQRQADCAECAALAAPETQQETR